jgi:tetratricopeptide (TPR) repeat protein
MILFGMAKRASLLIFIFVSFIVSAAEPATPSSIEAAQTKALAHQRKEASAILIAAIEDAKAQPKLKAKLTESLEAIATTFFTDKGQKLFESAQSSMFDAQDVAIKALKEALVLEDNNLLVCLALVRANIAKKEYSAAKANLEMAKLIQPYSPDVVVLSLRLMASQGEVEPLREQLKTFPPLDKTQDIFVKQLLAQDLLDQQMTDKSFELFTKITEMDAAYPEPYYFMAKAGQVLGKETEDWSRKYVSLCKNVDARTRRKYANEPMLCSHVKEVEDDLAKKTSEM